MAISLDTTSALIQEVIGRLAEIAAIPDNGEPVSPISAALDFQVDAAGRDLGDVLYDLRDKLAVLIGPFK
jgi:hypothetical protein